MSNVQRIKKNISLSKSANKSLESVDNLIINEQPILLSAEKSNVSESENVSLKAVANDSFNEELMDFRAEKYF